jgi:hypothetical protein
VADKRTCTACQGTGLVPLDSDADTEAQAEDVRRWLVAAERAIWEAHAESVDARRRPVDVPPFPQTVTEKGEK